MIAALGKVLRILVVHGVIKVEGLPFFLSFPSWVKRVRYGGRNAMGGRRDSLQGEQGGNTGSQ